MLLERLNSARINRINTITKAEFSHFQSESFSEQSLSS